MLYYIRDEEGSLIGLKYNDNLYYYLKNMQEDIIGITDENFNKIVSYTYDPWGKIVSIKDNNNNEITDPSHIGLINPFRYRSYYYDTETKLYYLNSRYYNPDWGRFINADNILVLRNDKTSQNLYNYVNNNPINSMDSTGKNPISSLAKLAWKAVSNILNKLNMPLSSTLLRHSVQKNPANLEYNNSSEFSKQIKNDNTFINTMKEITVSNPNTKIIGYKKKITFTSTDLHGSLHGATLYVNGTVKNGMGKYNITVYDYYDFKWEWYKLNSLKGLIFSVGNNLAYADQVSGLINNYEIHINLDYENIVEGAMCPYE